MAGDVRIGRDAVGSVITTGDHNLVEAHVTATKREAPVADPAPVDVAKELAAVRALLTCTLGVTRPGGAPSGPRRRAR
jgi:hypothetical protein